jgi:hypothetical protein
MHRRLAVALGAALIGIAAGSKAEIHTLTLPREPGGLSAIDVLEGGAFAYILSDRGFLYRAAIIRDTAGRAVALHMRNTQRLRHDGETRHPDSEGLAISADGAFFVSTEDPTRVLVYRWGNKDPDYLPDLPTTRALDDNRGFEALAIAPDGALHTLFEMPERGEHTIYRFHNGQWSEVAQVPAVPGFAMVGADFDDTGRLYLLERAFSPLGFRTRLRRLTFGPDGVQSEILLETEIGRFDNLEGVSVWRDDAGMRHISMISDNNFLSILDSALVEMPLPD